MCVSTNGLCGFCDSNLATERPTVPKPTSAILSFLPADARCSGAICSTMFDSGRGATDSHLLLNCAQKMLGRKLAGNFRQSKPPRGVRHGRSIGWPRWWPYCRPSRDRKELDVPGTYQAKRHSHCSHDERGYTSSHKRGRPYQIHVEPG